MERWYASAGLLRIGFAALVCTLWVGLASAATPADADRVTGANSPAVAGDGTAGGGPVKLAQRYGSCPRGYDWNGQECVPNRGSYEGSPRGRSYRGSCPRGYDWNGYDCVPNYGGSPHYRRGGACPRGYDWNGYDCVPNNGGVPSHRRGGSCPPGYEWDGRSCVYSY
jgi:hypothetical protein